MKLTSLEGSRVLLPKGDVCFGIGSIGDYTRLTPNLRGLIAVTPHCLLAQGDKNILINAGPGVFLEPGQSWRAGIRGQDHKLLLSLKKEGLHPDDIDIVVLTDLGLLQAGGVFEAYEARREPALLFPKAQYVMSRGALRAARAGDEIEKIMAAVFTSSGDRLRFVGDKETSALLGAHVQFLTNCDPDNPGRVHPVLMTTQGVLVFGADLLPVEFWDSCGDIVQQMISGAWWAHLYRDPLFEACQISGNTSRPTAFRSTEKLGSLKWDGVAYPFSVCSGEINSVSFAHSQILGGRKVQQDSILLEGVEENAADFITILADGHGPRGGLSSVVVNAFRKWLLWVAQMYPDNEPQAWGNEAVRRTDGDFNAKIIEEGLGDPDHRGEIERDTGSTLDAVFRVGNRYYFSHTGDGRIYRIPGEGKKTECLTVDHRDEKYRLKASLGHVTYKNAGLFNNKIQVGEIVDSRSGDLIVLCSDGLCTDGPGALTTLTEDQLLDLTRGRTPEEAVEAIMRAIQPMAWDNASVIVFKIP